MIVETGEQAGGKNIYKNAESLEGQTKDADATEMTLLNSNGQQAAENAENGVEVCLVPVTLLYLCLTLN